MQQPLAARGRALPLRAYFVGLFVLVVLGALAGALYVDRAVTRDARDEATQEALNSARVAAAQLDDYVALLRATPAGLAANPQIAQVLESPQGCTLTFQGIGGPDRSHLDLVRADGKVVCSSKPLGGPGYAETEWLRRAVREPIFLAPERDVAGDTPVAIASAPIPGGKGAVVAFADLGSLGPHLARLYGGGRANVFVVTTADDGVVVSRSLQPERWIGKALRPAQLSHDAGDEVRDPEGVERLYAQAKVPSTGWNVRVGERKSVVLASADRLRDRQFALIGFGLLLLLLAGAVAYRKVAAPIRRLSGSVRAARGAEAAAPMQVSGPAEVQTLAGDVNALTTAVQAELQERRRAEAAAAASEESYRLLFESNPSPMWVFDARSLRFLAVNDAAVAAYGYTRDEFLAMTIDEIRAADEVERLHSLLQDRPDRPGLRDSGIWRHRRKDGSEFDVQVHSHDHLFEGHAARVVLALDVTERLAAEQGLRLSEARYRELFENASDLIATVDLEGRFTDVNEAFVRTLGYERAELIGSPLEELLPPESRATVAEALEQKLAGSEPKLYEHELTARDGRRIHVEVATRLIEEDGRPVGREAICRDITARRELEAQLRQAQRLESVGQLAGGIAHDFNNLLTVISGYTEVLLAGSDHTSEQELSEIAAAAKRATILTRQLLAFSRRQILMPRVLRLNDVVEGLLPMLKRLIGEDVELDASLAPDLETVLADPSQLEQVLVNLVVNARDAMPDGGKLTVQTGNVHLDEDYVSHHGEVGVGPHVMLSVTDTGVGMDSETAAHVFEPFFTTKPVGTGTGLGLATVYGIVKQSGGSIWVYSEPAEGTTVKIYLPKSASLAAAEPEPDSLPVPANGSETILLAEDEPSLRELTAFMLEHRGFEVIAAPTSRDAVRLAEENAGKIDLLLTDLVMPELSGRALAAEVRSRVPNVRVLFMSGYADDAVRRSGSLESDAAFLEKPFSANDLATKVRETLDAVA